MKFSQAMWLSAGAHAAAVFLGAVWLAASPRGKPTAPSANVAPLEMTLEGAKTPEMESEAADRREFDAHPPPAASESAPAAPSVPEPAADAPPPLPAPRPPSLPEPDFPDAAPPDAQPLPPPAPARAAAARPVAAAPSAPQLPAEERRENSRVDSPAKPRRPIKPEYPKAARLRGEQGRVVLRIRIDGGGRTQSAEVAASSGFEELDAAALRAVRAARFVPAKSRGVPVPSTATLALDFRLDR